MHCDCIVLKLSMLTHYSDNFTPGEVKKTFHISALQSIMVNIHHFCKHQGTFGRGNMSMLFF